jgi:hypothetical protein
MGNLLELRGLDRSALVRMACIDAKQNPVAAADDIQ